MKIFTEKLIEKPLNEVTFKWFDINGNEVHYGKHVPWLFEVRCEGIDPTEVLKVELPVCDYSNPDKFPLVKIYIREIEEDC